MGACEARGTTPVSVSGSQSGHGPSMMSAGRPKGLGDVGLRVRVGPDAALPLADTGRVGARSHSATRRRLPDPSRQLFLRQSAGPAVSDERV